MRRAIRGEIKGWNILLIELSFNCPQKSDLPAPFGPISVNMRQLLGDLYAFSISSARDVPSGLSIAGKSGAMASLRPPGCDTGAWTSAERGAGIARMCHDVDGLGSGLGSRL